METKITLNDSDIRYGIIKIAKHKEMFGVSNCDITIVCKNSDGSDELYKKRIPSRGGYISGLTKQHRDNKAVVGTVVKITKTDDGKYRLDYGNKVENVEDGKYRLDYGNKVENVEADDVESLIVTCRAVAKDCSWALFHNETNVRTEIIDPILEKLGWKFPVDLFRELVCYSGGNVDYALRNSDKFCMLIEAKSIEKDLNDARSQIASYIDDQRFDGCIGMATNGICWQVIDNEENHKIIADISIFDDPFCEFIKLFKKDSFDIKVIKDSLKSLGKSSMNMTDNLSITDDGEDVKGNNPTEVLVNFVKKHIKEVIGMQKQGLFNVKVVSTNLSDFRSSTWSACIDNAISYDNSIYYITRDHSTFQKRMIAQQIINVLGLNAEIED